MDSCIQPTIKSLGNFGGCPVQDWFKLVDNILLDKWYNSFDASEYQLKATNDIKNIIRELESSHGEIVVLKHLPRLGKTYTLLDYLNNSENILSLYVSDIHDQMGQMAGNFEKMWVIKGAAKICPLLTDKETPQKQKNELKYLFSGQLKRNLACRYCGLKNSCAYTKQFDFPETDVIVTIAKESLPNIKIHTAYDYIIFDENMIKAAPIEPTIPELDTDIIANLTWGYELLASYEELKKTVDSETIFQDEDLLNEFKSDAEFMDSDRVLRKTMNEIKELNFDGMKTKGMLPFIANLFQTVEWAQKCFNAGEYRPKHFKPYLHDAFDLLNQYGSNLILCNATFTTPIYQQLQNQYSKQLPEIKMVSNIPIINEKSFLLNYQHPHGRNCSRTGLEEYGTEIFKIVEAIPRFCEKRGLKSGIITFPEYEEQFPNFNVVDHFVAHRGKNDFDNVDVLTILGTNNIPRLGVLLDNYKITGEYLPANNLKNWNPITINGCKISIPTNKTLQDTRLYLLYDEHLQAILRSRAHIIDDKVIITFGYVPDGVEKMFTYKTFTNTRQLINGLLTNIYTKNRRRKRK